MPERLWAPWRMRYVESANDQPDGCIFDDLPAAGDDRENLILHRGKAAFVLLNAFPYTSGHLMIAPYRHVADPAELTDEEMLEIQRLIGSSVAWIRAAYKPDGFNIGANIGSAAGAGIPDHLHWHVVPRWKGDTNFLSTVGETRVLPESLEESYDRLRAVTGQNG